MVSGLGAINETKKVALGSVYLLNLIDSINTAD
jgi:hypothetical protein